MLSIALAAATTMGPIIKDYGPVFTVKHAAPLPAGVHLKAVFDIIEAPAPGELDRRLESVARYLNMHAQVGLKPKDMELAVVLHGPATRHALSDAAHEKRFKEKDGSAALLDELAKAGVKIYVCGQAYAAHDYGDEELRGDVTKALSALTELTILQQQGYSLLTP
ncbi:DsrE family protein [Gallaecimonas kandeliae]|uniref:DsrE family protein n=1 Tax=Gallaecimonas kandeliae TaxID=3029055 RepID=UPI0026495E83|nr:DsrE family protein [Gallaecimonas kandeliae]WKE64022.1 DsrE family protein [Gallaecimonas kandeliae]